MINLSLYNGVPSNKDVGIKQFWEMVRDSKKKPFLYLRYIVLKKNTQGKYKSYWSVWTQDKKPKQYERGKDKFKFIWDTKAVLK